MDSSGKPRTAGEFFAQQGWDPNAPVEPLPPRYAPVPAKLQAVLQTAQKVQAAIQTAQTVVATVNRPEVVRAIATMNSHEIVRAIRTTRMALAINRRPVCPYRARGVRRRHRRQQHIARATSSSDPPGEDDADLDPIDERRPRPSAGSWPSIWLTSPRGGQRERVR
jgi:hypothetical protein